MGQIDEKLGLGTEKARRDILEDNDSHVLVCLTFAGATPLNNSAHPVIVAHSLRRGLRQEEGSKPQHTSEIGVSWAVERG